MRIRDEIRDFLRAHAAVLAVSAGALLLAYGFALTTFTLSIDEELRFLGDRTGEWIDTGRPVVAAVQLILSDTLPMPFFDLALALACLFIAGVAWAALYVRACGCGDVNGAGLLVYIVVFTTLPVNAFYLTFNTFNVAVSLGLVFGAASSWLAWLWVFEKRGPLMALGALATAFMAVGTYQNLVFATVAGVLIAQLASLLWKTKPSGSHPTLRAMRDSLLLISPAIAALLIDGAVHLILVPRGGYTEGFIAWGTSDVGTIIDRLSGQVAGVVTGSLFPGGWVMIPTLAATVLVLGVVLKRCFERRWWYPLLITLGIVLTPFALSMALGSPLPNRAMQPLSVVAASMWLLLSLSLPSRSSVTAAMLASAVLLSVWNAGVTTRYFVTEYLVYESDRDIAARLADELLLEGWDGHQSLPIVAIGQRQIGAAEGQVIFETFGGSFFNWDQGRRTSGFMRVLGYNLMFPTSYQQTTAEEFAEFMPIWPLSGSVAISDGVGIVKFSEP